MGNVLLVVPPNRESATALREAVGLARARGGRLVIAAILDPEATERVSEAFTEVGFMGEKVSDSVRDTLSHAQHAQAEELVQQLAGQARAEGVEAEPLVEEGSPSEVCQRLVTSRDIRVTLSVAERRHWLTRLLARETIRLPHLSGCEVRVLEEG